MKKQSTYYPKCMRRGIKYKMCHSADELNETQFLSSPLLLSPKRKGDLKIIERFADNDNIDQQSTIDIIQPTNFSLAIIDPVGLLYMS